MRRRTEQRESAPRWRVQAVGVCRALAGENGVKELPIPPRLQLLQLFNKSFESFDKLELSIDQCATISPI